MLQGLLRLPIIKRLMVIFSSANLLTFKSLFDKAHQGVNGLGKVGSF